MPGLVKPRFLAPLNAWPGGADTSLRRTCVGLPGLWVFNGPSLNQSLVPPFWFELKLNCKFENKGKKFVVVTVAIAKTANRMHQNDPRPVLTTNDSARNIRVIVAQCLPRSAILPGLNILDVSFPPSQPLRFVQHLLEFLNVEDLNRTSADVSSTG